MTIGFDQIKTTELLMAQGLYRFSPIFEMEYLRNLNFLKTLGLKGHSEQHNLVQKKSKFIWPIENRVTKSTKHYLTLKYGQISFAVMKPKTVVTGVKRSWTNLHQAGDFDRKYDYQKGLDWRLQWIINLGQNPIKFYAIHNEGNSIELEFKGQVLPNKPDYVVNPLALLHGTTSYGIDQLLD
jgi:hypothetical protein